MTSIRHCFIKNAKLGSASTPATAVDHPSDLGDKESKTSDKEWSYKLFIVSGKTLRGTCFKLNEDIEAHEQNWVPGYRHSCGLQKLPIFLYSVLLSWPILLLFLS